MKVVYLDFWAVLWHTKNRLDGEVKYFLNDERFAKLFKTRRECRTWIAEKYGYIGKRPDLRREPHCWRMPKAIKVTVSVEVLND